MGEKGYWKRCLICGRTSNDDVVITEAHLLPANEKHNRNLYRDTYGTGNGFSDDLVPQSSRNYIPLCGTKDDAGTCHHHFYHSRFAILYNPFSCTARVHCPPMYREHYNYLAQFHGREINLPSNEGVLPYRRLIVARAVKVGISSMTPICSPTCKPLLWKGLLRRDQLRVTEKRRVELLLASCCRRVAFWRLLEDPGASGLSTSRLWSLLRNRRESARREKTPARRRVLWSLHLWTQPLVVVGATVLPSSPQTKSSHLLEVAALLQLLAQRCSNQVPAAQVCLHMLLIAQPPPFHSYPAAASKLSGGSRANEVDARGACKHCGKDLSSAENGVFPPRLLCMQCGDGRLCYEVRKFMFYKVWYFCL